jgi:hypothetical protein
MVCFCETPSQQIPRIFPPGFGIALPKVPIQLMIAPALFPMGRLDIRMNAALEGLTIPPMGFAGAGIGGLFSIAPTLSMIMGTFALDGLPSLQASLDQAATTMTQNLWPMAGWLASLKMAPLLNFALAARLVLDLRALGIDPVTLTMPATAPPAASFAFAMTTPKLQMARLMMGLPALATLTESFELPPLGDPGLPAAMSPLMTTLASIRPPSLGISMPMLLKLALALSSLAVINEAFGTDAFSQTGLASISAMLHGLSGLPIPFPTAPALALMPKLDALPDLPSVVAGAEMFTPGMFAPMMNVSMPKLAFMPIASLMVSIGASMQLALDMPAFDLCSVCPC